MVIFSAIEDEDFYTVQLLGIENAAVDLEFLIKCFAPEIDFKKWFRGLAGLFVEI